MFRQFSNFLTPEGAHPPQTPPSHEFDEKSQNILTGLFLNLSQKYAQNYVILCFEISHFLTPDGPHSPRAPLSLGYGGKSQNILS